eukprot:scaffold278912_cov14-Tisochrysis_lutea.AAC.1
MQLRPTTTQGGSGPMLWCDLPYLGKGSRFCFFSSNITAETRDTIGAIIKEVKCSDQEERGLFLLPLEFKRSLEVSEMHIVYWDGFFAETAVFAWFEDYYMTPFCSPG